MSLSPIAFEIGPLVIRWYALAYIAGILLGQWYVGVLDRRAPLFTPAGREALVSYAVIGIILGGRLGYVLFYNLDYYAQHPHEILFLWQGGMAFHGGFLGVIAAFYLFARRYHLPFWAVMDRVAAAAPIGLFLGRLANFVNGELYGRVTDAPWGMVFARGGDLPRHPSQLYEAGLEGVVLFTVLFLLITRAQALQRPGLISGMFALGYGIARFSVECVREPDTQLGFLSLGLTMGQWLCLPMVGVGLGLVWRAHRTGHHA